MLLQVVAGATGAFAMARQNMVRSANDHTPLGRVVASRSLFNKEDSPHARKGKKGLGEARRSEPTPAPPPSAPTRQLRAAREKSPVRATPPPKKAASTSTRIAKAPRNEPRVEPRGEPRTESRVESRVDSRVDSGTDESAPTREPFIPPVLAEVDRIEVIEAGSRRSGNRSSSAQSGMPRPITSNRRIEVDIDAPRVMQIQQALLSRGFLSGELTGIYDEQTVEAMRQFQMSQKIDVTGYPTAHALKRLGL